MQETVKLGAIALGLAVGCSVAHAQTPIPPSPPDFLAAAAQSDAYEIMAAHLAEVQSRDKRVQDFARKMIEDHKALDADLRHAAAASGLPSPPPAMSSDQAMLLGGLQGLRGADFDKAYARQQELAHAQTIAVMDSFAAAGGDGNLKAAAKAAMPKIEDHLGMAKELRVEVGGG